VSDKEVAVAIKGADGKTLYRAELRAEVEEAVVGKWITIDLSELPPLHDGDKLELWTGTICE
jgi:hypothetical protein